MEKPSQYREKEEFSEFKRESRKTREEPSVSSKEIFEVFEETAGFIGLSSLKQVYKQTVLPSLRNLSCDYICTQSSGHVFFRVVHVVLI